MNVVINLYRTGRHGGKLALSLFLHFFTLLWIRGVVVRRSHRTQLIAVALIEHLGDIVACEPIARHLRQEYPNAYIVWMVKKEYRELIERNPSIDAAFPVHCLTEKAVLIGSPLFDRTFDLHFPERRCALCPGWWGSVAGTRAPGAIGLSNFYDFGSILRSMALSVGLPPMDEPPQVYLSDAVKKSVDELQLPAVYAVLHCTSNTPEKDWPREKWEEVANHLSRKHGCGIVEVGMQSTLGGSRLGSYHDVTGMLSILETAEVIRRGRIFTGVDSGPAHLANAVGVFGVVLLGSYLGFKQYTPFSGAYGDESNASLIHVEGAVMNLSVERVLRSIDAAFQTQGSTKSQ